MKSLKEPSMWLFFLRFIAVYRSLGCVHFLTLAELKSGHSAHINNTYIKIAMIHRRLAVPHAQRWYANLWSIPFNIKKNGYKPLKNMFFKWHVFTYLIPNLLFDYWGFLFFLSGGPFYEFSDPFIFSHNFH